MRISTSTIYDLGVGAITRQQSALLKTQQQLASGSRILTPADDPIAAARALETTQADSMNTQYSVNRGWAKDSLSQVDGVLTGADNLLQDVKQLVVQAGNGSYSDSDRLSIATTLKSRFDELVSLANSTDGTGKYLFSGYSTSTPPFTNNAGTVQYSGDEGQRVIQVSATQQLQISESGRELFERVPDASGGYQSIFKTINDLVNVLQTPVTNAAAQAALTSGLSTANDNVTRALDHILAARATVGANLNQLDNLDNAGQDLGLQYKKTLSSLQDVDYAKAISDLNLQQVSLQAAQQSFQKITSLSLFDYIK
jgi:flagellar hook-associated protein 3 FlgL